MFAKSAPFYEEPFAVAAASKLAVDCEVEPKFLAVLLNANAVGLSG